MNPEPVYIRESYRGSGKLRGKVAMITGGDSGIGRAVAVHFAREGADVAIVYLNEDKDAQTVKQEVEAEGQRCLLIKGDQRRSAFCDSACEQLVKEFGQFDILVNNAAVQYMEKTIEDVTDEQLAETFETNVYGYFYMTRAAIKYLPEERGAIINTTSVLSYQGMGKLLTYSTTKGANTTFTRALSGNLADKGIRVNGVAPGPIWTPFIPSTMPAAMIPTFGQDTPLGRAGQPCELAPAYVYLACEDSSYVTGQVIHVNGGTVVGA